MIFRTWMGNVWNNLHKNLGGNQSRNIGFNAKNLKSQSEVQTALVQKLIAGGEYNFQI